MRIQPRVVLDCGAIAVYCRENEREDQTSICARSSVWASVESSPCTRVMVQKQLREPAGMETV